MQTKHKKQHYQELEVALEKKITAAAFSRGLLDTIEDDIQELFAKKRQLKQGESYGG